MVDVVLEQLVDLGRESERRDLWPTCGEDPILSRFMFCRKPLKRLLQVIAPLAHNDRDDVVVVVADGLLLVIR